MSDPASPTPGFVVKVKHSSGLHYVNVCSHPCIERPLDGRDMEVDDERLRTQGLENLRVPLLAGVPRTVAAPVSNGADEEAICVDVVFSPAVLAVALHGEEGRSEATWSQNPELTKFVRVRLAELALKNAEEELRYPIGRHYTLPRGLSYKGGIGGGRQPVPMPNLRKLAAAVEAAKRQKEAQAAPGPWRSKRDAAGLANHARIEEVESEAAKAGAKKPGAPLLKKGFLNASKGSIYPNGSDEGMLYGDVKVAGDPLGYIPKGLRNRVNVVDTATTSAEEQRRMMEEYADTDKPARAKPPAAASGGAAADGSGGSGGGVSKGFLNKNGGSLYPEGSKEGGGGGAASSEYDALREMVPSHDELKRIAEETDPNTFMSELSQLGSLLGLSGDGGVADRGGPGKGGAEGLERAARHAFGTAAAATDVSDGPHFRSKRDAQIDGQRTAAAPSAAAEATPEHEILEAEGGGSVVLKVKLPLLDSLAAAEVDVSSAAFALHAPGLYKLDLQWPHPVDADDAKAKFSKKSRTLQVTLPIVV